MVEHTVFMVNKIQQHWEDVYKNKPLNTVSWYQPNVDTFKKVAQRVKLKANSAIIDIGGGDSFVADFLVNQGFKNANVLDISKKAIERAKKRLNTNANKINWIISDITSFETSKRFDLWYDRAAFHFLNDENQIDKYAKRAAEYVAENGYLAIASFSKNGPEKCSGLPVKQHNQDSLKKIFGNNFKLIDFFEEDHQTPTQKYQNFTLCIFQKK